MVIPRSQYIEAGFARAFGPEGRMKPVVSCNWPGGYSYHPIRPCTTDLEFNFSRRSPRSSGTQLSGSNISAVWTRSLQESLINGVLQGRKQIDPRGASAVSRQGNKELSKRIASKLRWRDNEAAVTQRRSLASTQRKLVKDDVIRVALRRWIPNVDDGFDEKETKPLGSFP